MRGPRRRRQGSGRPGGSAAALVSGLSIPPWPIKVHSPPPLRDTNDLGQHRVYDTRPCATPPHPPTYMCCFHCLMSIFSVSGIPLITRGMGMPRFLMAVRRNVIKNVVSLSTQSPQWPQGGPAPQCLCREAPSRTEAGGSALESSATRESVSLDLNACASTRRLTTSAANPEPLHSPVLGRPHILQVHVGEIALQSSHRRGECPPMNTIEPSALCAMRTSFGGSMAFLLTRTLVRLSHDCPFSTTSCCPIRG